MEYVFFVTELICVHTDECEKLNKLFGISQTQ